jgi:flagellar biosynthesis protein FlhG
MKLSDKNIFSLPGYKSNKHLPEIMTVTSGKGGVGKTTISVNLSILLSRYKKRVLLVDADIHLGNVDFVLGIRPKYTMADVIAGDIDLRDIIIICSHGIDVLPASSALQDLMEKEEDILKTIFNAFAILGDKYDLIVVDTGAGISGSVMSFVLGADKVIIMVTPDPASIADAYGMIKIIKQTHSDIPIMIITNMVDTSEEGESLYKKMELMVHRFLNGSVIYGGAILKDNLISNSIRQQRPLVLNHPNSTSVNILKIIARRYLQLPNLGENKADFSDRFVPYQDIIIGAGE